ncbi:MAG: aminodeoxychorismate lyase [Nitrosomonadales bacterium]|nr:aminodeoxychorismate lyase [Nitrosomonadales bacterium]
MLVNGKQGNLISIRDRGLLYGDGVFRTMRALHGKAQHWPLHYQKLQHDCAALGLDCPDKAMLASELEHLLVQHPEGVVKLIVTRGQQGKEARGYAPPAQTAPSHIWDISTLPDYPADRQVSGIKARLCQLRLGQQPRLAGIKHLNRLENVLAAAESDDAAIAEGLLLDSAGNVIEGIRSNVFLVSHGKLITPDLSRCGVAGVQRDRVIAWAAQHHIPLQVRDVVLPELMDAEEVFVVNSLIALWPVRELEQRRWNDFPVATRIRLYLNGQDDR